MSVKFGAFLALALTAAATTGPAGDGRGDETYEVVLRNVGDAPAELSAAHTAPFFGRCNCKVR